MTIYIEIKRFSDIILLCNIKIAKGASMTTLTIRLSEEDKELFKSVSKDKNMVLSDWARETLIASIEEEYDKKLIEEYLLNKKDMKFYTSDEVKKELGL